MNLSGNSVAAAMQYNPVELSHVLIVADDVAIALGEMRLKAMGSSGGHNGLQSVENSLRSQSYPRLRLGVGDRREGDLSDYVLGKFLKEEEQVVSELLVRAEQAVLIFIKNGLTRAMDFANRRKKSDESGPSTPCIGKE